MNAFASFFFLYTVVLCIHLWRPVTASSMLRQNETDRLALIAFKAGITQDTLRMLSSWNDTLHFCRWLGVYFCRQLSHRIKSIFLWIGGIPLTPHREPHLSSNSSPPKQQLPWASTLRDRWSFIPLASSLS